MLKRLEKSEEEVILSVIYVEDIGSLHVELGDEKLDDRVYGCAPTESFIKALAKEISFHIKDTFGDLIEDPTLVRVHKRFTRAQESLLSEKLTRWTSMKP